MRGLIVSHPFKQFREKEPSLFRGPAPREPQSGKVRRMALASFLATSVLS